MGSSFENQAQAIHQNVRKGFVGNVFHQGGASSLLMRLIKNNVDFMFLVLIRDGANTDSLYEEELEELEHNPEYSSYLQAVKSSDPILHGKPLLSYLNTQPGETFKVIHGKAAATSQTKLLKDELEPNWRQIPKVQIAKTLKALDFGNNVTFKNCQTDAELIYTVMLYIDHKCFESHYHQLDDISRSVLFRGLATFQK